MQHHIKFFATIIKQMVYGTPYMYREYSNDFCNRVTLSTIYRIQGKRYCTL